MLLRHALAAVAATAVLVAGVAQPVSAAPRDPVRPQLQSLVADGDFPGALAAVRSRDGRTRNLTAGVGDLRTGAKVPVDGQVRIGSNTKTFVAVAVLQLVADGKVGLDSPVETYLPGLLRGEGIDGRRITVRQLLQHTSGLPNYTAHIGLEKFFELQHTYQEPRELLDIALSHPADFAPGAKFAYSNTNYVVAGLLIQKVTRRPLAEVLTERVINRAGLRHTSFPAVGEQGLPQRHPHGYHRDEAGKLRDVTELDPSWGLGRRADDRHPHRPQHLLPGPARRPAAARRAVAPDADHRRRRPVPRRPVRPRPDEHPAELRRPGLGPWWRHSRVRDARRRHRGRPCGDGRGDGTAGRRGSRYEGPEGGGHRPLQVGGGEGRRAPRGAPGILPSGEHRHQPDTMRAKCGGVLASAGTTGQDMPL